MGYIIININFIMQGGYILVTSLVLIRPRCPWWSCLTHLLYCGVYPSGESFHDCSGCCPSWFVCNCMCVLLKKHLTVLTHSHSPWGNGVRNQMSFDEFVNTSLPATSHHESGWTTKTHTNKQGRPSPSAHSLATTKRNWYWKHILEELLEASNNQQNTHAQATPTNKTMWEIPTPQHNNECRYIIATTLWHFHACSIVICTFWQ